MNQDSKLKEKPSQGREKMKLCKMGKSQAKKEHVRLKQKKNTKRR